jgi:cytochrome c553
MNGQAQPLTDEEMRNLAAYYASQSGPLKVVR